MIQLAGRPFHPSSEWPKERIERVILERMVKQPLLYSYPSARELAFELKLRKNILITAKAMNAGQASFKTFSKAHANPKYWRVTRTGGFLLRSGALPSQAIQDVYLNSSLYGFECATAMMLIYYHAVLTSIGEQAFNQWFQSLYVYSWHADPDLGIHTIHTNHHLPGDVVYFNNPDFHPKTSWWRGENAVVLEDGTYFGHGIGIGTAEQFIGTLNKKRKPGSQQSAYLTNSVTRPGFNRLAQLSLLPRTNKIPHGVIHHNESSISFSQYVTYFMMAYHQLF
ncbi:protein-glutamine gamma-glutamyltransferase [Bacillus xiapuensis]|uniref:protein-glutamine gamma-glutamyltransferase n=1 Tax=Bacillus xiapuensis TaxID=2014075 RepID=UPI000C24702A|nr:protein-glutamine gamma-glutamyltransferase [Bacillus xiapuensis]